MKNKAVYNKLVRDNILEIIGDAGKKCTHHTASDTEYDQKLREKLFEEIEEFYENPCEEEMADILEVITHIMKLYLIDSYDVETARQAKEHRRGAFEKRIILEEVWNQ